MKDRMEAILGLMERIPVPVVIASPITGKILWVNSHIVEMAGARSAEDVVGKSLFDFIQPRQQSAALRDLARIALGESPPPVTYDLLRADGSKAAGQTSSISVMYYAQPAMLSVVTDVSDKEKLIRDATESEQRYRLLVDNLPSGLLVTQDDVVVFANDRLAHILGCPSPDSIVGRSWFDFVAQESAKRAREIRKEVLLTGRAALEVPLTLAMSGGGSVDVTISSARVPWEGGFATQTLVQCVECFAE